MSKSTTSTRSNSVETPGENEVSFPSSPQDCPSQDVVSSIILENGDNALATDCLIPTSPPPSYEHVLEETRLAAEQSSSSLYNDGSEQSLDEDSGKEDDDISQQEMTSRSPESGPKILHKSSKELYKAVAKQFGITCKMSDQCRCFDCQSHYFECEYEENEQEKTDGGLGAGTPMFISEVMHGTACTIL